MKLHFIFEILKSWGDEFRERNSCKVSNAVFTDLLDFVKGHSYTHTENKHSTMFQSPICIKFDTKVVVS